MIATVMVASVLAQASPECRTSGTAQACGYHCRAELDQVACARTPEGLCQRLEGTLVCWDPPEEVRLHAPGRSGARCRAKYRDIACGYACVTSPNHIACAQTPWGVCSTRFDTAVCWDPPPAVIHHFPPAELGGARCIHTDTAVACGWHCKRSYGDAKCAQTPRGTCTIIEGRITCFDPPLPPIAHEPVVSR